MRREEDRGLEIQGMPVTDNKRTQRSARHPAYVGKSAFTVYDKKA